MFQESNGLIIRALLWAQTYTRTDMVYLASGGFWLMLAQVASSFSALVIAVAFAHLVSPETYGTYKYILSIAALFAIFTLPGMNIALSHASARGKESVIHAITRSRVLYAFTGGILALVGSVYYFRNENAQLALALLVVAVTLPLFDTLTTYLSYFVGKRRFDLRTKYLAFTQLVSTLALLATIACTNNLILILLAYFLPLAGIRAILYRHVTQTISHTSIKEEDTDAITYGKHLTAMQILGMIANEIDKILIWKFLGPVQVATYTFALAIPEQTKGPLKGIGELAFPKFAAQTSQQIRANLPGLFRKIALYALGLFSVSLLYAVAAPYIFSFLFPQYMASVTYSQIFALSIVTNVASIPLAILSAQKKTSAQYIITTIQPITTIGLLLLLVPTHGIMGAIIALVLSKFIASMLALGSLFTLK